MTTRTETDSMGAVEVPADRLWGAQTQRSHDNFAIGGERMPREVVHAIARVKQAGAEVNGEFGGLAPEVAQAIAAAAAEVADGRWDDHFPLVVWQTGSGTQSNMNVNEVIANLASERLGGGRGQARTVHPNDDVNRGQSSNDVVPTAMAIAAATLVERRLIPAGRALAAALAAKATAWREVVIIGRTHLMDATPLRLGDQAAAWARQIEAAVDGVAATLPRLRELAIGGTAVGTGLGAPVGFADAMVARLAALTGLALTAAPSKFEAMSAHDAAVATSGALRTLAVALTKITSDIRLYGSGPRAGLGELTLPANEPGSSIMPGKVNPTQVEAMQMIAARVLGNDVTIGVAGAGGQLQLNACKPVIADALLQSLRLLADGMDSLRVHCVDGLAPASDAIADHLERSLMLVTALAPRLGYDVAARVAHHALAEGTTLREAVLALGLLPADEFDRLVRPENMLGPGR
ncbi:MAG: class II fumarate hydratase [Kofleriaceae bacterium]